MLSAYPRLPRSPVCARELLPPKLVLLPCKGETPCCCCTSLGQETICCLLHIRKRCLLANKWVVEPFLLLLFLEFFMLHRHLGFLTGDGDRPPRPVNHKSVRGWQGRSNGCALVPSDVSSGPKNNRQNSVKLGGYEDGEQQDSCGVRQNSLLHGGTHDQSTKTTSKATIKRFT